MQLTYRGRIGFHLIRHDHEMHRVLGPDTARGYVVVVDTEFDGTGTTAICRPLPPEEMTHVVKDGFGQWWLPAEHVYRSGLTAACST